MSTFVSLSEENELKKLDARRMAAVSDLLSYKEALETLNKEKPSLRTFQRLEGKIDEKIATLEAASTAVAAWFTRNGGKVLEDADYKAYRVKAVKIINEIEILREEYYDLLDSKGLLKPEQPAVAPVDQNELISALKTLAESSGQHAAATLKQATPLHSRLRRYCSTIKLHRWICQF